MTSRLALVVGLALVLAACVLPPVDISDRACPCLEGWVCDALRDRCVPADSMPDAGPGGEACNARDDDGDERVDEGSDLCGVVAHAQARCVEGACVLTCDEGFADCNAIVVDGCEASLGDAASCGACDVRCAPPAELCVEQDGAHVCTGECPSERTLCGSSCVDPSTSSLHCGGCDQPCALRPGVASSCVGGTCSYTCLEGRADCDDDPTTCEADVTTLASCGGCDVACATAHNTSICDAGECVITACEEGWDDCDGDARSGCETDLATTHDCGACGTECAFPRAAAACVASACAIGACDEGFADCNGVLDDGCESDLESEASCGACGVTCPTGESCHDVGCAAPDDVVEVSAGDDFACARLADGRVYCWGADGSGQLGNGAAGPSTTPVAVSGLSDAIDIDAGARHACAVRRGGGVVCWGENEHRQLGEGGGPPFDRSSPVAVTGVDDALQVAAGRDHTCVRRAAGAVSCWGRNDQGQLGDGSTSDRSSPVAARGLGNTLDLAAGDRHTCAVRPNGDVACWGNNSQGAIGDGTTMNRSSPVAVSGISGARRVSCGAGSSCAVLANGVLRCWGDNASGQLGDGTTSDRAAPVAVATSGPVREVECGGQHTCALLEGGSLECWGLGSSGQLGAGTLVDSSSPKAVAGIADGVGLTSGATHSCAVLGDGAARCWGAGGAGRLGDGGTADQPAPVAVTGLPGGS